jgi:hypothetical protein
MEREAPKLSDQLKSRFGFIIFFFRLAGIPFKIKSTTIYALYRRIMIICTCSTTLAMFIDVYVHRDHLEHTTANTRLLIPVTNNVWIYLYIRYVTTLGDHRYKPLDIYITKVAFH